MRAVQITRFGGPEVLDVVDLPDPSPVTASGCLRSAPPASTSPTRTTACRKTYLGRLDGLPGVLHERSLFLREGSQRR
jgi:hypothetical protein